MSNEESKDSEFDDLEHDEFEENEITEIRPELYSKRLIITFSALFSTIFGAVLLISNLKKEGRRKAQIQVLIFALIYTIGLIITLNSLGPDVKLSIPLNVLGALILNEYFWNRYIGKEKEFEKKSWIKPALISTGITLALILALIFA